MTTRADVTQRWRALWLCAGETHVDARCTVNCVGRSCFSLQLWALSLRSCKVSVGCAPVLRRPLISADVVANIAAAAVPTAAAAAVPAAEHGWETKGHGSKAEAPHL